MVSEDDGESKLTARDDPRKNVVGMHEVITTSECSFLQGDEAPQVEPFGFLDIDVENLDIDPFPPQRRNLLLNEDTALRMLARRIHMRDEEDLHHAPPGGFI
jgi:hypothetical protein